MSARTPVPDVTAERCLRTGPAMFDEAERRFGGVERTFFSLGEAADRLGVAKSEARELLAGMEGASQAALVCRDGWVLMWHQGHERQMPELAAYLDDMMRYLGVGYYLSYAAAADRRGASHHGVMRQRVNVETDDLVGLELMAADGPADLAVSFHRIEPSHGRPACPVQVLCLPPAKGGPARSQRRTLRTATTETALLDMVEHPHRCGGMDHVATIARKMLFWDLLHPALLAEASDRYEPQVALRTGSMLQQLRGVQHRIPLGPLMRKVRSRPIGHPVEMHSAEPTTSLKPDRWGVAYVRPLEPDA